MTNGLLCHQGLYEELQCMLTLKSSSIQTLWWLTIFANSYLPLKGFIDRFCHKFANIDGLEGKQLWLNPRHSQPAHKDDLLQTSQNYHQRSRPDKCHYCYGNETPRAPRLNHHQPQVTSHLKVLVIAMLFLRHQTEAIYWLSPPDKWLNWEAKYHNGSLSLSFCHFWVEWLGMSLTDGSVCR